MANVKLDAIVTELEGVIGRLKAESNAAPVANAEEQKRVEELASSLELTDANDVERRKALAGELRKVYTKVNATGQPLTSPRTEVPMPQATNPQPTAKQEGVPVPGGPGSVEPTTPVTGQAVREQGIR